VGVSRLQQEESFHFFCLIGLETDAREVLGPIEEIGQLRGLFFQAGEVNGGHISSEQCSVFSNQSLTTDH
jgi:hypothetical protein